MSTAWLGSPALDRAVLMSPRKPLGPPPHGSVIPLGKPFPPAGGGFLRSGAYCLPWLRELSKAFSSKCGVVSVQDNRVSLWSAGDLGNAGLNGEYHGEPRLLCDIQHNGDVMDMQVK